VPAHRKEEGLELVQCGQLELFYSVVDILILIVIFIFLPEDSVIDCPSIIRVAETEPGRTIVSYVSNLCGIKSDSVLDLVKIEGILWRVLLFRNDGDWPLSPV
jgi:hypothetical protein